MTGSTAQLPTSVDGRHWHCLDVVSDLHLQASEPATWRAFEQYLKSTPAQALFILGDLFEVWIGDDVLDHPLGAWEQGCVAALAKAAERLELFWIPGNRDFLTGDAFASRCGAVRLDDPCQLLLPSETCLLSHGDALCLQDRDYMAFRAQVRTLAWAQEFLARPLPERQSLARAMREQSKMAQKAKSAWSDVDDETARAWLQQKGATHLIHGHTHQPAEHDLGSGWTRSVLSDWSVEAVPPRAQVLRWQQGWQRLNVKTL